MNKTLTILMTTSFSNTVQYNPRQNAIYDMMQCNAEGL